MPKNINRVIKEKFSITLQLPNYVGYIDYYLSTPFVVQLQNDSAEEVSVKVTAESAEGLIVPYEAQAEVPFESAVSLSAEGLFSPALLSECDELKTCTVSASVQMEDITLGKAQSEITVLPYDWWEGLTGNAERLAAFVRPRLTDCARVLSDAGERLKKWKAETEFYGYTGADKNTVRQIAAAVFAAIKSFSVEKTGEIDLSVPVSTTVSGSILKERGADALQLAVFAASCLEAARLHPVLAVGKNTAAVGVWLYDTCFLDSVTDDTEIVGKYVSDGINNLSFFDAEDLFATGNAAYTLSETHFRQKLKENYYECFVDVRRCRVGGVAALPLRGKGVHGYELVKEEDMSDENAPAPLPELKNLHLEGKQPKNKQWERRLLDLTTKNPLLHFTGRNALHIFCPDPDALFALLEEKDNLRLKSADSAGVEPFGGESPVPAELISLEQRRGILRAVTENKELSETVAALIRKNREADEETGAKILYLAYGFLRYMGKDDGKPKYAPLVLSPVAIKRAKGNESFSVENSAGEYFVNSTLLEYLKQEFNIDVRGLGGDVSSLKISEIFAMVRAETSAMKGWEVVPDVYLAAFSFQRYLMWNDIRNHIEEFKKNATVSALINGYAVREETPAALGEDEDVPGNTLIPLPADSSQYAAIALSRTGKSFVLHGPPGTGKSQTITNIIANALADGKRVLFVAEKKAALDVVKKRLDAIGIGEFCLELHSNKADKADVLKRMEQALSLAETESAATAFSACAEEILDLRDQLKRPMLALHKKRRLGMSVYQAILTYLQNKNAPDVMDIESSFYDTLTEKKLTEYKSMILSAAAAAKECGGVCNSPFENVNINDYTKGIRDRLYCSCEVVLTEIRHFKSYLALYLEFYRQKIGTVTQSKIDALRRIAGNMAAGVYDKYFAGIGEEEFNTFYHADKRLHDCLAYYERYFKTTVEIDREYDDLVQYLETGGDYRLSRAAVTVAKKLNRAAIGKISEEDMPKFLQTTAQIHGATERLMNCKTLCASYVDRSGDFVLKKYTEFVADLRSLHQDCAAVFLDYNPDSFNAMCIRAQEGYTRPVLEGFIRAAESFAHAQEYFFAVTHADTGKLRGEDVIDYFTQKAAALIDNIDLLPGWCMYRKTAAELAGNGLKFITDALESGKLKVENILSGFEKNVCKNFLEINIPADPELSRMTVGTIEDTIEKFRLAWDEYSALSRRKIRNLLISRVPNRDTDGSLSLEISAFTRFSKSNLRGTGLRALFEEIPTLTARISPCMLMSPTTVAQYLTPTANAFDLVIFDEASQMTTAEAVGSIARAKAAIVVGDPKQLPPTSFFHSAYVDEENLENEDLESILDDCLALGLQERHLLWHYRSKHESLIAFSNGMYYDNKLCTFPSPDSLENKVRFVQVEGTYDRGFTKRNRKEAEALVAEVIRRLSDPVLSRSSLGVVTFSGAQQEDIERLLTRAISSNKLESVAYEREEPLFVKNLENVQGDERDVILFSVCYGPDKEGRVSLNFGPLNQAGGWRRLNVAVSRAREEMVVFSTMTAGMIDPARTSSKGVMGLKAFLEFAERGRTTLAVRSSSVKGGAGIGKFLAAELSGYGYDCRCDVGASDFKIDVAVVDPKNRRRFILAIICDGIEKFSVKDRNVLQVQTLKRGNWNVMRLNCVNYYNNPKREIKRIKDTLDKLTGTEKKEGAWLSKYKRPYKSVAATAEETAAFITSGENDAQILSRLKEIVSVEEPISRAFLKKRCLSSFGIAKSGTKVESKLDALIDASNFRKERILGADYFYKNDRAITFTRFRTEDETPLRKTEDDFTPFEVITLLKGALEDRVSFYMDEALTLIGKVFRVPRQNERFISFIRDCVAYGEQKGLFIRSVSDRLSLA